MDEVSGGKLLSQKSQTPVFPLPFVQAFTIDEISHGETIFVGYSVSIFGDRGSKLKFVPGIEG